MLLDSKDVDFIVWPMLKTSITMKKEVTASINEEVITSRIHLVRGQKVMLERPC